MGKEYANHHTGTALELMTMGYQFLLADNQAAFKRLMEDDPKLVDLLLGALFHF